MLFRLTFLLVTAMFLAMYLAPEQAAPPPQAERPQTGARPADPFAQDRPAAPSPQAETTEAAPEAATPPPAAERPADLSGEADSPPTGAKGAGESVTELSLEGLSRDDAASALDLSERIRQRAQAEGGAAAAGEETPPEGGGGAAAESPADPDAGAESAAEPEARESRAQVVATNVNLRAGPSTDNPVIGQVDFGDEVTLLGEAAPGWSRIRHPETGEPAFMASRFLQELGN